MRRLWRGTLVGILIGIVSGLGAIVFNFLLQTGTRFFTHDLIGMVLQGSVRTRRSSAFPSAGG